MEICTCEICPILLLLLIQWHDMQFANCRGSEIAHLILRNNNISMNVRK